GKARRIVAEGQHATSQTTLRWTVFLLFALLVIAADFGLDVVLGAFLAGVVLRRWAPGDVEALEAKLDAVGYGFHPGLLRVLRHESRPQVDHRVTGAPSR